MKWARAVLIIVVFSSVADATQTVRLDAVTANTDSVIFPIGQCSKVNELYIKSAAGSSAVVEIRSCGSSTGPCNADATYVNPTALGKGFSIAAGEFEQVSVVSYGSGTITAIHGCVGP